MCACDCVRCRTARKPAEDNGASYWEGQAEYWQALAGDTKEKLRAAESSLTTAEEKLKTQEEELKNEYIRLLTASSQDAEDRWRERVREVDEERIQERRQKDRFSHRIDELQEENKQLREEAHRRLMAYQGELRRAMEAQEAVRILKEQMERDEKAILECHTAISCLTDALRDEQDAHASTREDLKLALYSRG